MSEDSEDDGLYQVSELNIEESKQRIESMLSELEILSAPLVSSRAPNDLVDLVNSARSELRGSHLAEVIESVVKSYFKNDTAIEPSDISIKIKRLDSVLEDREKKAAAIDKMFTKEAPSRTASQRPTPRYLKKITVKNQSERSELEIVEDKLRALRKAEGEVLVLNSRSTDEAEIDQKLCKIQEELMSSPILHTLPCHHEDQQVLSLHIAIPSTHTQLSILEPHTQLNLDPLLTELQELQNSVEEALAFKLNLSDPIDEHIEDHDDRRETDQSSSLVP